MAQADYRYVERFVKFLFVVCGWLPDLHLRLQPVGTAAEIGLYPHGRAKI